MADLSKELSKELNKDFAYCEDAVSRAENAIGNLPSAQPEIIHCKECKYGVQDEDKRWYCRGFGCQVGEADGSGFCADAERRTKDEDTL